MGPGQNEKGLLKSGTDSGTGHVQWEGGVGTVEPLERKRQKPEERAQASATKNFLIMNEKLINKIL